MEDKQQRMRSLVEELNQAAEAYYNGRGEQMTDYEWDAKFDLLKALEKETGIVLPDSPTHKVSEDDIAGKKEEHEFPTLSLAKTKKTEELVKWAEGRPIWLSWKLDGLTLVATYDDGRLTKVVTRGNGHQGTNITHLARAIAGIPESIPEGGHIVVRGEAVIAYDDFEQFNMESEEEYANPRNLAAGSLTLKDAEEVKARRIQWMAFTLVHADHDITSWGARMDFLERNGFRTVEHELISRPTLENIEEVIARWTEKVTHRVCPYPVDGLVITYDDVAYAQTGSVTGHHATRAGYAFKWQDESAETQLEHIEWSCAANTINPVAVFQPVELEGTTVRRASLCNVSECERLGIGGEGSMLSVIKANKIIPKVIRVSQAVGTFIVPSKCPVCQQPTEVSVSEVSGTKTLRCTNGDCPAKQLKKFVRFVSKEGMDIDGISEQTLAKFINLGWVSEPADLYHLSEHATELARMEGFGKRSVANLLRSVEVARHAEARKLLYALTIPMCGQDVCKRLLAAYPLRALIDQARLAQDPTLFTTLDGIGPAISASLVGWCHDERNIDMLNRLLGELELQQEQTTPTGDRCGGLTFVVTGDVYQYKNRGELKAYIESQGGKVAGSVSKATDYLINNDTESTSSKNQNARQLGTPILSEAEFIDRFGEQKTAE